MSEPTPIDTGDIMRDGIINMPFDMAMGNVISQRQFYQTAQQTLRELAAKSAEVERLKAEINFAGALAKSLMPYQERAAQAEAKNIALIKAIENLKECLDQAEARAESAWLEDWAASARDCAAAIREKIK